MAADPVAADIRLVDLTKRFEDVAAVDGISFDIERGSFFAMLGPSGCGKTTTLRMIGGFEEPTSGLIELGGRDVSALPPYRRDVNTVFQSYALFPHLTVYENVAFGLRRRRSAATSCESASSTPSSSSGSPASSGASRASSPAASSSASRSPVRSSTIRACSCSTSRSARST